ncbi:MAG: hypothetical protein FJZ57_02660 [Chlamydiae bacterium]|nr:hypothetical protein [Chlamydiota bacterium]
MHFEGKSPKEHLKEARLKGLIASYEVHGMEMPGHIAAFADSMKDTTTLLLMIWALSLSLFQADTISKFMILFSLGWIIWKPARSAMLGWGRLERLHRLIEEERWEIDHNREQEKIELRAMYEDKGFKGKLLDEIVDTLMSDDNRLLQIMLEEELGLTLEIHEHPLKQALGSFIGAIIPCILLVASFYLCPPLIFPFLGLVLIGLASYTSAKLERNKKISGFVWNIASIGMVITVIYVISKIFVSN